MNRPGSPGPKTLGLLLAGFALWLALSPGRAQGTVSVVINSVGVVYDPLFDGYQVTGFLTALGPDGQPILGLSPTDLLVREDGLDIPAFDLELSTEGLSLLLAIDTSGSMASAGKMEAVKQAAASFAEGMQAADQIGLMSFNENARLEISITSDRAGVQNFVNLLQPVPNASTCLWDAAYEAVEVAASMPRGRRAVVLLTDGVDEFAAGGPCSIKTLEDVVAFANEPTIQVPVYAIGVGARVNEQDLARLSDLTGGRSLLAANAEAVEDVFAELGLELSRGYALRYLSSAAGGEHTLFVQLEVQGARDQDTRSFRVLELSGRASFQGIDPQQAVGEDLPLSLEISAEAEPARAEFYLDGELIGQDDQVPLEGVWQVAGLRAGEYRLRAVVYDSAGELLAVARAELRYEPVVAMPTPPPPEVTVRLVGMEPGQEIKGPLTLAATVDNPQVVERVEFLVDGFRVGQDDQAPYEISWQPDYLEAGDHLLSVEAIGEGELALGRAEARVSYEPPPPLLLVIGLPVLLLAAAGGGFLLYRRSRPRRIPSKPAHPAAGGPPVLRLDLGQEVTAPSRPETLATLTIEACQDPDLVGQRFEIWEDQVSIGRSPACDVVIPVQPVSRVHAVIRLGGPAPDMSLTMDEVVLQEQAHKAATGPPPFQILDGEPETGKPSTYGTYVGEQPVPTEQGLALQDGSRIRLGRSIAEGRIPPVILLFRDLREQTGGRPEADLTSDALDLSGRASEYETEDFPLQSAEEDDFKTEEFGPSDPEAQA
jgi:pSer/pThr/pTyr-binding forkhead associated (FHA) protein